MRVNSGEHFIYKGVDSRDMYLRIENDISFSSPEADIEFVKVLGKDGDVAIDNNRLRGVRFGVPVQLRLPKGMNVNEQATRISNWLKNDIKWSELIFGGDADHVYKAILTDQFDVKENLKNYGKTVLVFRMKPVKHPLTNKEMVLSNGMVLKNPTERIAKPVIRIQGSGDITFKNNGEDWLILSGVDHRIIVDSEMMAVYKDDALQNGKMSSLLRPLFPLLSKGDNQITWSSEGDFSTISIEPRWEVVV